MKDAVTTQWERIRTWLAANAPEILNRLRPGATGGEIAAVERAVGAALPDDLKIWLSICDGGEYAGIFLTRADDAFPDALGFEPLSIDQIIDEWGMWKSLVDIGEFAGLGVEADRGVADAWWSTSWVPFAGNGAGDYQCVDLGPTGPGTRGQIVGMWHDHGRRDLIASSMTAYLAIIAEELASGRYAYDAENEVVVAKGA